MTGIHGKIARCSDCNTNYVLGQVKMEIFGDITQLGECHNGIVEVESSNLFSSTKKHSNRKAFSFAVYYYMNEKTDT
jgi:hypothetical protein